VGVACGIVASGVAMDGKWLLAIIGVALAGPFVCATSQAVNDWFDRHVDAINEPQRPIPSGRMPGRWGLYIAVLWTLVSLGVASLLGPWGFGAAVVGLMLACGLQRTPFSLERKRLVGQCSLRYQLRRHCMDHWRSCHGGRPNARQTLLAAGSFVQHWHARHHDFE
jgi:chlorophyll/bacteriochlorophyll a synthase